jgi:hypothetical protein
MAIYKIIVVTLGMWGLLGCTAHPQPPAAGESVVHLEALTGNQMLARRLDARVPASLTRFVVSPGAHVMELGFEKIGYQESRRSCIATVAYDDFAPDTHYTIHENSAGGQVRLVLVDANGRSVASSDNVACL